MFLGFGEVMLRVAPPGFLRFRQALPGQMVCTCGGAEANVCAALAFFGAEVRYLTALPKNPVAEALVFAAELLELWSKHGPSQIGVEKLLLLDDLDDIRGALLQDRSTLQIAQE